MEWLFGKIATLEKEMSEGDVAKAEVILHEISDQNNPQSIELLMKLFDDSFRYDEFMFSIIHCIEKFEDSIYVHYVLKSTPALVYRSPRWASILHMRILNSADTLISYIKEIQLNATIDQKRSIEHLLNSVNKVDTEFLPKTLPLLVACKL